MQSAIASGAWLGKHFVDIGFAVGNADARSLWTSFGHFASRTDGFHPADAFLFLDRHLSPSLSLFFRGELSFDLVTSPTFLPRDSERQTMIVKRNQGMEESSQASIAFDGPCSFHLLLGASEIKFGCVLHQKDNVGLDDPLSRGFDMRL